MIVDCMTCPVRGQRCDDCAVTVLRVPGSAWAPLAGRRAQPATELQAGCRGEQGGVHVRRRRAGQCRGCGEAARAPRERAVLGEPFVTSAERGTSDRQPTMAQMTRARRVAAIALCAGLAVGIAGQLSGNLDLPGAIGTLRQTTERRSGATAPNQAASSVPKVDEQTARLAAAQGLSRPEPRP